MHADGKVRHRCRWWLIGGVAVVAVMVGAAIGFRTWLIEAPRRITVDEAVERYRTSSTLPTTDHMPGPGVYRYSTLGSESVDALSGDTHSYPAETAITVTPTACGYDLAWTPLSGRSDSYSICAAVSGLRQVGTINVHSFFRITQQENFQCDEQSWWLPPAGVTTWTSECRSPSRTSTRQIRLVGNENVSVGSTGVPAVHVHIDDTMSAGSTGTSTTDLWLDTDTGLPVRMASQTATQNDTQVGSVEFEETWLLTLLSQDPRQ